MFPYGMARNPDGSWTFFNRKYKPLGTISDDWEEWDDPKHKMFLKGLGPKMLAKLDWRGEGNPDRIYFYNDGTNPTTSAQNMKTYLHKLGLLMGLEQKEDYKLTGD